jgi:hypothetical protein
MQLCRTTVLKSRLFWTNFLFFTNMNKSTTCYICKEKKYDYEDLQSLKSAKKAWICKTHIHTLQIRKFRCASHKSAKCNICVRFATLTNYLVRKLADLRFAELIFGRASLVLPLCAVCYFYHVPVCTTAIRFIISIPKVSCVWIMDHLYVMYEYISSITWYIPAPCVVY